MKLWKYEVIFVYILHSKMGKTEKNWKKIMQLKWSKYQKPKGENMGWTKRKLQFFYKLFFMGLIQNFVFLLVLFMIIKIDSKP